MRSHTVVVEPTDASADFSNPTGVGRRQYLDDDCAPTSVDLVEREVIVGSSTPSSAYEDAICRHLDELLATCKVTWSKAHSLHTLLLHDIIDGHTFAIVFTCCMLLCACIAYISTEVLFSSFLSFVVFALAGAMHSYLVWARKTESKYRTAAVIGEVLRRWKHRIEEMPTRSSLSPSERRRIVLESFARIPSKAFRMVAVVDDLTYRLKHIPKCLMISRSKRLDEATLVARIYKESVGLCKLMDVVREILQGDAIVLKPLIDRARPPRLPNLLMTNKKFVEEEATTDESDHERESRSALGGDNSISVSHHMEYFVHRVLLLSWVIAMVLLILSGMLHSVIDGTPIGIGVLLSPSIALLGLLPVNAMLLSRSLVLYANVYLDKLFHHIVAQRLHNVDDRLPRFSISSTLAMCIRILLRRQPSSGGKNPSLFSVSLVDGFGMATVIAMLDQKGIVTDMVLLPITILVLREDSLEESSSSERDDCHSIVGCLTERAEMEAEERQREMKRQIRRKKFHESRFLEMHLAPSSREELAVNFVSEKERRRNEGHINPVCLCILIHALAKEPTNLETWTEPFRFSDRSFLWARALHWIPRACGFDDRVAEQFVVLARIFQIDTKTKSGYRNTSPEQMCSLLARGPDDMLHVFTMGSPYMVSSFCTTHWTGTTVDEFETEEKKEVVFMGKHQWEEGMCLETVALSHRVLPERYRKYVQELPTKSTSYSEFFFRDGKEVNRKTWMERCQRREARREQQQRAARMNDGTDMAELALSPLYPSMAEGVKPRYDGAKPSSPPGTDEYEEFPLEKNPIAEWVSQSAPSSATTRTTKPKFKRNASFGDIPLATLGMFEADDCLTASTFIQLMATTSHTFLGLVGLRDSVRPSVQEAMSILDGAGVRCMYFCPDNERQTKSFGRRVGLETDWNCCISLKEDAVALDPHSIRAQLPFGIKSIRKHILHVDPIPLQVNLFSHAQGVSKRAMLSILQDNHEVVLAVGSVFNHANVRSFVQADLSIGVLPTRRGPIAAKENILRSSERVVEPSDFSNRTSANRDIPLYRNIAELIGCSCALRSPPTVSILPILATMVRQGRLRLSGIGNAIEFVLHANIFLVLMNSVVVLMGGPLLLSPSVTVLELNIFIPLLSLSCTYTAYSGIDPMKTMPSRHNYFVRLAIFRHSSVVWLLRYTPSLIAIIALGITALTHGCGTSIRALLTIHSDTCITAGRSYVLMTMNYWMLVHSWCHMSRHQPISLSFSLPLRHGRRSTFLFTSFRWLFVSLAVAALSVLLVLIRTPREGLRHAFFPSIPHFVVALLFPAVILVGDIAAKRWRERRFSNMQKYRKLTFGTRLGMHSPRGDYEPEGINYTNNFVDSTSPLNGGPSEEENTVTMHGSPTNIVVEAEPDITVTKRLNDWFYRYTSMLGGKLELNCVCCDHIGGNYATYHVSAKDM